MIKAAVRRPGENDTGLERRMGFERRRSISCEISIRFVAMHMVESGPSRHLMRRSDLVALGGKADLARSSSFGRS
jgi:hypothetical protein